MTSRLTTGDELRHDERTTMNVLLELPQRFWEKVNMTETCWLWTGACTPRGYSRFAWEGHTVYGHRLAYEALVGPIPDGLVLDHGCRVHECVNPAHLEPVTQRVNTQRGAQGFALTGTCKAGHIINGPADYYTASDGRRACRRCNTERARTYRARRNPRKAVTA